MQPPLIMFQAIPHWKRNRNEEKEEEEEHEEEEQKEEEEVQECELILLCAQLHETSLAQLVWLHCA